jgi:Uma2 family endonuclease
VSWKSYVTLCDEIGVGATRMVYDNGHLHIMTTSSEHEQVKAITGRMLGYWATEKDWPVTAFGQTTLRRDDLRVGLEADESYYVQTPAPPPTPGEFDLHAYAPPDLAIEIEITRSSVDKVSIYGRLGVGEVWRWTGQRFVVLVRQPDGQYAPQDQSRCLPQLPMDELAELVRYALSDGQPAAMRLLRDRLRSGPAQ